MTFNSLQYAAFLAVVVFVVWQLPRRARNGFLLAASYLFYGSWDWRFLALIVLSTAIGYTSGLSIAHAHSEARRRQILATRVAMNIVVLGVFKYFDFFAANAERLLRALGLEVPGFALGVILPVGVSFYTFQELSYVVDVYRGQLKAARRFTDFALFVCFFPQLVAGPIERAQSLLPQFKLRRHVTAEDLRIGLWLLLKGYFMKLVVADNLGVVVDDIFSGYGSFTGGTALAATYAFTFQVYGDFAGYSHIARGAARLMGIQLRLKPKRELPHQRSGFRSPSFDLISSRISSQDFPCSGLAPWAAVRWSSTCRCQSGTGTCSGLAAMRSQSD